MPMGGDRYMDGIPASDSACTRGRESEAMNFNLAVILSETAAASPDKPAALYDGGQLSYRELISSPTG